MSEVNDWLNKAKEDFDTAKYNIKGEKYDAGIFFLQQSAEKALKAIYIKKFKKLLKTHDLVVLARSVDAPNKIIEECKSLTGAYQFTRYPDIPKPTNLKEITDNFLKITEEVLLWTEKNI